MIRVGASLSYLLALASAPVAVLAVSDEPPAFRQTLDDAWWTGPLLAASPSTLPQGHVLIEPYLYDSIAYAEYGNSGSRRTLAEQNDYGSLTYILYGLLDTTTVGLIPRFGFNEFSGGDSSSSPQVADTTLQATYRLSRYLDYGFLPATSIVLGETVPTGRYDRLGDHSSNGLGSGAYTTTLSLYSQYYLWTPNGRILRARLDVAESWSSKVSIDGTSVYGTAQGFRGRAYPGNSMTLDSAWEYSMTRDWVAAVDFVYVDSGSTRVAGAYARAMKTQLELGTSNSLSVAPAIEYNWSSTAGVIVGAKWVAAGHNTTAAIVPVAAINLVF